MRILYHIILTIPIATGLIGCAPIISYHGNDAPDKNLASIRPALSTHKEVSAALGTPNATSLDGKKLWLYISRETKAWLPTFESEKLRRIVAVQFNSAGKVKNIRKLSAKNGRIIAFVPETTAPPIAEVNWIQRLFGNIGRVTPGGIPRSEGP